MYTLSNVFEIGFHMIVEHLHHGLHLETAFKAFLLFVYLTKEKHHLFHCYHGWLV